MLSMRGALDAVSREKDGERARREGMEGSLRGTKEVPSPTCTAPDLITLVGMSLPLVAWCRGSHRVLTKPLKAGARSFDICWSQFMLSFLSPFWR